MQPTLIKVAASTLAIGASIVGLTPVVQDAISSDADAAEARASRGASDHAAQARAALGTGDTARAIASAEAAVEAMPRSAEYRHLLGQAYLAAGRLDSAETSFQDALTINESLDRTAFNLALVQIAQGRKFDAREELARLEGRIGAPDLGLAMALAGDHDRAIAILTEAVRADAGNAKARQNLALSYALAGRWAEARVNAAQDVSMAQLDQRMREWAAFAQPANSWDQVASMLGLNVNPSDPGQPMRLALAPAAPDVMVAEATSEDEPIVAFTAPAEDAPLEDSVADGSSIEAFMAPVDPASYAVAGSSITEVPVPAPVDAQAPVIPAETEPMRVASADTPEFVVEDESEFFAANEAPVPPAAPAPVVHRDEPAPAAPAPRATRRNAPQPRAPEPRDGDGRYMVQIGAYAREQNVERGWDEAVRKYGALASYTPNRADYDAGGRLYRLAFGGYDSHGAAAEMCRTLKSRGVDCFVRARAGDMPLQMAIRAARRAQQTAAAHRDDAPRYASMQVEPGQPDDPVRRTGAENGVLPLEFVSDVLIEIAQLV